MLYSSQAWQLCRAFFILATNIPIVSEQTHPLNFNFGFLLASNFGAKREIEINNSNIDLGNNVVFNTLKGIIFATRTSSGIYINGALDTDIAVECARCLKPLSIAETLELDDLYYYPPSSAPEGEQRVEDGGYVNLKPIVRDLGEISQPLQTLCEADCQGLCKSCGENLNLTDCDCVDDDIDPRMAELKALLDKKSGDE